MDGSYADALDIAALAASVHLSRAHFIRSFRQAFGETPHRYLQRRRLERAMALLRETDRPVTQICLDVGFGSLGTFSRTFREIVGTSPSAYREREQAAPRAAIRAGVPGCHARLWDRPSTRSEKPPASSANSVAAMLNALTHTGIWVLDHDQALDFYVGKLGLEVRVDADLGFMRWLTVTITVPGRPEREIILMVPGPPALDGDTAEQLRALIGKGAGGVLIFTTDDCWATYEALQAKGVEFDEEPVTRFYGRTSRCATCSETRCGSRSPRRSRRRPDLPARDREADPAPSRAAKPVDLRPHAAQTDGGETMSIEAQQQVAADYASGELTRRDAVAILGQLGVNGIAAGRMLADAQVQAGGGGAAAGPPSATA